MFNLTEKKTLITGGSRGIGKEIATKFIEAGAEVIITGTNQENLDKVANDLGDKCSAIRCDLSDDQSLADFLASNILINIDILVCNAGITKDNLFVRMKDDEWNDVIKVNLSANFKIIRATIKGMMKKRYGRIINISSVVGTSGNPGQANYCASKAGIIGLTKSIALEIASRNITANSISPGFIKTDMTNKLNEQQMEAILKNIPSKRMGEASDIANTALFLASSEANYITGQNIHINGGLYLV